MCSRRVITTAVLRTLYPASLVSSRAAKKAVADRPPLRKYLMSGDFFVASVLAATLAKLALRYCRLVSAPVKQHRLRAEAMLVIASMMHLGRSGLPEKAISDDDLERLQLCLRVIAEPSPLLEKIFLGACKDALNSMLKVGTDFWLGRGAVGCEAGDARILEALQYKC